MKTTRKDKGKERENYRILPTYARVLLPVALRQLDGPVVSRVMDAVKSHVADVAAASAAVQIRLEASAGAGPDFDARTVAGAGHGDVLHVDVLDDVELGRVLAQRADGDAVRAATR